MTHETGAPDLTLKGSLASTRLMLCKPTPGKASPLWDWYRKTIDAVARPGTTVDFVGLRKGYTKASTPYAIFYNAQGQVERAYEAEKKGYDAFMIGCAFDPGLKECRSVVNIPVVAPLESAALLSCTLGNNFSIIVLDPSWIQMVINSIRTYGLKDKLASIRCPRGLIFQDAAEMSFAGGEKQAKLVDLLVKEMGKAIEEDGAEVLFVGCTIGSTVLSMNNVHQVDGRPIIDPLAAEIKMAEVLADFQRVHGTCVCKSSIYHPPSPGWEDEISIEVD